MPQALHLIGQPQNIDQPMRSPTQDSTLSICPLSLQTLEGVFSVLVINIANLNRYAIITIGCGLSRASVANERGHDPKP